MAREKTVVKGIVLRAVDTKESDKILTVLTPGGKLPVIAKGARSRKSRVTACTQLLAYSELTLSESRGWQYLSEGSPIQLFEGARRDIALLSLASYFAELTEAAALENVESGEILSLLLNALYALGELKKDPALVKAAFELKLMSLIGFERLLREPGAGGPGAGRPGGRGLLREVRKRGAGAGDAAVPRGLGRPAAGAVRGSETALQLLPGRAGPQKAGGRQRGVCPRRAGAGIRDAGLL